MRFSKKQITNAGSVLISAKGKKEVNSALDILNLWSCIN